MRAFVPSFRSGTIDVAIGYADNEKTEVELMIFLSPHDWCEIQKKPFYQELIQHLDTLKTQDNRWLQHDLEYSEGIKEFDKEDLHAQWPSFEEVHTRSIFRRVLDRLKKCK